MTGRDRLADAIQSDGRGYLYQRGIAEEVADHVLAWLEAHPDPGVERAAFWRIARDTPRSRTWIDAGEPDVLTTAGEARVELEAQRNYDGDPPGTFTAVRFAVLTRRTEEPW